MNKKARSPCPRATSSSPPRKNLVILDQAHASIKFPERSFLREVTAGRRNFEDPRLWLYDAALDGVIARFEAGYLQVEASITSENGFDGDLFNNVRKTTPTTTLFMPTTAASRTIGSRPTGSSARSAAPRQEGRPVSMGLRAYGRPADIFNYWADAGVARGHDE